MKEEANQGPTIRHDNVRNPPHDDVRNPPTDLSRRTVLKLMAASALLAAGTACTRKPPRNIVSMADSPEYQNPGMPLYYASTWTEGLVPYGMVVKTVDGRPIKLEGHRDHPLNRGASSAAMQASLLSLYDPDRLREPQRQGQPVSWETADKEIVAALQAARSAVLITRSSLGPSERALVGAFRQACPAVYHFVHETAHDGPRRSAWRKVFGSDGAVRPRLDRARVIVSFDADFLGTEADALESISSFSQTRAVAVRDHAQARLSRLYVVESTMTVTGSNADHRLPLRPSLMVELVQALRAALKGDDDRLNALCSRKGLDKDLLTALVKDLDAHRSEAVVLGGAHLPEALHAAVSLLNDEIDAPGKTLEWNPEPPTLPVDDPATIAAALEQGVDVLICLGINPVYDWPGEGIERLLEKAQLSVGHGLLADETVGACTLSLPSCHNLESWNDAAPLTGVRSLCQPVIAPLFDARQEAASLCAWTRALTGDSTAPTAGADWFGWLREQWETGVLAGEDSLDAGALRKAWEDALRKGFVGQRKSVSFPGPDRQAAEAIASAAGSTEGDFDLVIAPHHALLDGRFANNGWLQEFPDPVSKLVWDNAASVSPSTAARLGLDEGRWAAVQAGERTLVLPVLIQPGTAPGVVATTLGHGRTRCGVVGEGQGFNTALLVGAGEDRNAPRSVSNVAIHPAAPGSQPEGAPDRYELVRTQKAFSQEGRPIVLDCTSAEYAKDPASARKHLHIPANDQLDDEWDYSIGHKWAMAVDLSACVGCGACTVACQAENNIPVVGKSECALGREMAWIRIDRYQDGDENNPKVSQQPMLCQHCDNAPCESVCPVNATAHSPEGLNEQVYNRCVGTRYCANNCPYKVRRFNFYNYTKENVKGAVRELSYNPQVTVRSRGVMEKCTFCVQRINEAKFRARNAGDEVDDGAIQPACVQTCPAGAIVFGDLNDPESRIAKLKASPLAYHVLEELNVRPNVAYLARVRNPHPDLIGDEHHDGGGH